MKEQINIISRKKRQKTHDNSSLIRIGFFSDLINCEDNFNLLSREDSAILENYEL